MPSSWDAYYLLFLSAVLALVVPIILAILSRWVAPERPKAEVGESSVFEPITREHLGQRINSRFFLGANSALILISLVLTLFPCVSTLQEDAGEGVITGGL